MDTLAPRASYDQDELGITRRLPVYSGVFFGTGMGVVDLVDSLGSGQSAMAALLSASLIGVLGGALFGTIFPWTLRRLARTANDRLYAGDPRLVPPPAPGYRYRLPCGWMRSARNAVGGVLYLGRTGMRFDPHLRNPARFRESLNIGPLESVQLGLVHAALPGWMRIWGHSTVPRIEVRWEGHRTQFTVPEVETALVRLQACIVQLKQEPGQQA